MDSWAYTLQNYKPDVLRAIAVDLLVVDMDELNTSEVTLPELKARNGLVLSYLSIGEAEGYRSYWRAEWSNTRPSWLGDENPNWPDNFKVHFWNPEWQSIMRARIAQMAKDGYDGAYLDLVDSYYYYEQKGVARAKDAMVEFVATLAEEARAINPKFKIVVQNAAELIAEDDYADVIDGIANEDTWYYGDTPQPNEESQWMVRHLRQARDMGKLVLTVEYATRFTAARASCRKAGQEGFSHIVAPRSLGDPTLIKPALACANPAALTAGR